jgi:hypothetical protein
MEFLIRTENEDNLTIGSLYLYCPLEGKPKQSLYLGMEFCEVTYTRAYKFVIDGKELIFGGREIRRYFPNKEAIINED